MGRQDYETETLIVRDVASTLGERMRGQDDSCADNLLVVGALQSRHSPNGHGAAGVNDQDVRAGHIVAFGCKDTEMQIGDDVSPTLRSMGNRGSHANGGGQIAIAIQAAATRENPESGPDGIGVRTDDTAFTLEARAEVQALAFESRYARNGRGAPDEIVPPLKAQSGETGKGDGAPLTISRMGVRRLTPREAERLQGFPDDYTLIRRRGKPAADAARYKALGNSMVVPVMAWIGKRIDLVEKLK